MKKDLEAALKFYLRNSSDTAQEVAETEVSKNTLSTISRTKTVQSTRISGLSGYVFSLYGCGFS
jgi:hypothetical protein